MRSDGGGAEDHRDAVVGGDHEPADALTSALVHAREGDEDAFRVVYRTVQPGLLRYLRVLVGDDAEDVASEAWFQIARDLRRARFEGDGSGFRAWAATVARHRALDHVRRERRRPRSATPVDELVDLPGGEDPAVLTVSTAATMALISSLPRDQAEAVALRVVLGLDVEATARVLGKRPGAVRTAAYRGLHRLERVLRAERPEPRDRDGRSWSVAEEDPPRRSSRPPMVGPVLPTVVSPAGNVSWEDA